MERIPFLRFLLPLISGILFCKYISPSLSPWLIGLAGLLIAIASFFIPREYEYSLRWLFGAGVMLFLLSLSIFFYQYHESVVSYDFPQEETLYVGELIDFPEEKARSLACEVNITTPVNKKVMLYLETDSNSLFLKPGDQIVFRGEMSPFQNLGNPDEFDYKTYMHNKRFSGRSYINTSSWVESGLNNQSLKSRALNVRGKLLNVYKSFDIDDEAYSLISAITLGHKADLTDNMKKAFRNSGTSHVLALSGLHVGIIYAIILFFFSFLNKRKSLSILKQLLVLLSLWGYVFVSGMSVSVIRAAIMLSLLSVGYIFGKKGFTYNTLTIAAFIILLINPFYLFDVGFQLSFSAVLSILFFQPKLEKLFMPKYRIMNYIWKIITLSLAAQIGVFPIVLYYFGTFPSYFLITNLLVLPIIPLIIYATVSLSFISLLNIRVLDLAYKWIAVFMQKLINGLLYIVSFIESLPMAVFENINITVFQLLLIFGIMFLFYQFVEYKKAKHLIFFLSFVTLFLLSSSLSYLNPNNNFTIYNSYDKMDMNYKINGKKVLLESNQNQPVSHPSARILLLTKNIYSTKEPVAPVALDYLILASDNSFSVFELLDFYQPKKIILDSSLKRNTIRKLQGECQQLGIAFHDISNSGAYSIKF